MLDRDRDSFHSLIHLINHIVLLVSYIFIVRLLESLGDLLLYFLFDLVYLHNHRFGHRDLIEGLSISLNLSPFLLIYYLNKP